MASNSNRPRRILILGSGFGGLYTALHLEKKLRRYSDVELTLVNRENFFLFTPMLHEVAAGDGLDTHRQSRAQAVAPHTFFQWRHQENRSEGTSRDRCSCDDNHDHELSYDYLVLALG